ncbi:MAG: ABC transporter ATP-binding protein [Saprospiraceae bacterium]|nr:ABC transporter ATP-binding protein [Saprospiraceae bacterium]
MQLFFHSQGTRLLLQFLRTRRSAFATVFALNIIAALCVVGASWILAQLIAAVFGFNSVRAAALGFPPLPASRLLGMLGAVLCIRLLFDYLKGLYQSRISEDFVFTLRNQAFEQYLYADTPGGERRDVGRGLLRFSGDLDSARRLLAIGVIQFAADLTLLFTGFVLILILHARMAIITAFFVAIAWLCLHRINRRLRQTEKQRRSRKSALLAYVNRSLLQMPVIQALNRQARTRQRFLRKSEKVRSEVRRYARQAAFSAALSHFFSQGMLLCILASGMSLGVDADALFLVAIIIMAWRPAFSRLLRTDLIWKKGFLSIEKIAAAGDIRTPRHALPKTTPRQLQLKNLSLTLGGRPVFRNLCVEIKVGQTAGLFLPAAGGKTSLARLLTGGLSPDSGQILFDGDDVEQFGRRYRRKQMAVVSAAFPLSGQSIGDALVTENNTAAHDKARQWFERWQELFPVLQNLSYDEALLPHHPHLSGVQQRLLQYLRAFLSEKPFLILDEPFDQLDHDSTRLIQQQISMRRSGTGMLALSFRPEVLQFFHSEQTIEEKDSVVW